ncbi:MAG: PDDEXK nuclease domain-containing protein [Anaeroplasmataceae bacterium]|nr:PDDEXK nuclease domain-containing protein [Anaeroplasmataceae bacterium]
MSKEKDNNILEKNYLEDLNKIKETIKTNQAKAMVIVNQAMIMTYYEIGTIINQRKQWGNKFIERLSNDLKEYGKGYSIRNLKYMSNFANDFTLNEIRQQPAAQIPWFTLVEIMTKSNAHEEMLWYINQTYQNGWSRSMVLNQFKLQAYQRSLIEPTTSPIMHDDSSINELFKDTYVFDFIDIHQIRNERQLQSALLQNISKLLLELGNGFSFVSEKYKLKTEHETYEIDLLFYHIPSHCYVVIELKMTKFKPEYIGQLLFYTNYMDAYIKDKNDSNTIGIVLCPEADGFICKTTLMNTQNMGIAKYKFMEDLSNYLEDKLKEIK